MKEGLKEKLNEGLLGGLWGGGVISKTKDRLWNGGVWGEISQRFIISGKNIIFFFISYFFIIMYDCI